MTEIAAGSIEASPRWPVLRFLGDELAISPFRWSRMVRMTVLVTLITIVSQALRVPSLAVSAFLVFMACTADVATTVRTGIGVLVAVTVAVILVLIFYSLSLGEPALRVPLMVVIIFATMYFMRLSPAGPLFWIIGFVCAYALTFGDLGASPERLTRSLLWAWVFVSYPIALVVIADIALGKRPETVFRAGVAERLGAAAAYLAASGDRAARGRFERLERAGTIELAAYVKAGPPSASAARAALLREVDLLFVLMRELPAEAANAPRLRAVLERAGEAIAEAGRAVLGESAVTAERFAVLEGEAADVAGGGASPAALAFVLPLLACIEELGQAVLEVRKPAAAAEPKAHGHAEVPVTRAKKTEAARFACKVTLAAVIAYVLYVSLDWSGIHTAMLTCLIVAQASIGATIQKLTLRIIGAVAGATLGILAIIFVLPHLETIGGLAVLVAAVTLFASWIVTGTQAISYAGVQIAFAFYLTVLQGFTRTSEMVVGRDRVIGIVIGNLLMTVVFTTLWPVPIKPVVRQALARAMEALAATLRLGGRAAPAAEIRDAEIAFHTQLRVVALNAPIRKLEPGDDGGAALLPAMGSLFVPIHAIARQGVDLAALHPDEATAISAMSESVAGWLSASATALEEPRALPAFRPDRAAVETLEAAAAGTASPASALRLRAGWFLLLSATIDRLAGPGEVSP